MNQQDQKQLAAEVAAITQKVRDIPEWRNRYIVRSIISKAILTNSTQSDLEHAFEQTFEVKEGQ
jgi:hypothetical protein